MLQSSVKANGGMSKLAEEIDKNREALYRSFSIDGNPGINTLIDALSVFGLEISIQPANYEKAS